MEIQHGTRTLNDAIETPKRQAWVSGIGPSAFVEFSHQQDTVVRFLVEVQVFQCSIGWYFVTSDLPDASMVFQIEVVLFLATFRNS